MIENNKITSDDFSEDVHDEMNSRYSFFDGIFLLFITLAVLSVLPIYKGIRYMSQKTREVMASII